MSTPVISGPISGEQISALRERKPEAFKVNGARPARLLNDSDDDLAGPGVGMVHKAKGSLPNTPLGASIISAALGALLGAGLFAAAAPLWRLTGLDAAGWARPQLGMYLAAMGLFHLLEFWTTAGWNYNKLSVDGAFPTPLPSTPHLALANTSLPAQQRRAVPLRPRRRTGRVLPLLVLLAGQVYVAHFFSPRPLHL